MSRTIDERVVEMRFDNRQFEANVQTSMSTLDKLKKSLHLDDAAKGLEKVNDAAKKCDLSALGRSVEAVRAKFSALDVMAMTALSNITNSAINAGKRIASTFTVEPISSGFSEYELKMGSIQTIMASTGESLDRVNQKLDELNTYSDKTIYSFSDMTENIGKFTNAGVKLDDAVAAIQGVANVAAVSGANANEASRAMYNFGQAISSGCIRLIDWKSIENANMATVEFKEQLIQTALEMGTLVKESGKYRSTTTDLNGKVSELFTSTTMFNDSLSAQWMTSEVLTKTLSRYADETTEIGKKAFAAAQDVKTFTQLWDTLKESAQSGWSETWQLLIGDFDEAKTLFTEMSNFFGEIISASAKARNTLLKGALSGTSGWDSVKEQLGKTGIALEDLQTRLIEVGKKHGVVTDKMIKDAGSFEQSLKKGWLTSDIFSEALKSFVDSAGQVSKATITVTDLMEKYESVVNRVIRGDYGNGKARVKALTKAGYDYATIQGLVNYKLLGTELQLEKLSDAQLKNVGYTEEQIAAIRKLAEQAEKTGTPLNELIQNMSRPSGRELLIDTFRNALSGLVTIIKSVKDAWQNIFPPITSEQLYHAISLVHEFSEKLVVSNETAGKLQRTFKGLFAIVDIFTTLTGGALKIALKVVSQLLGAVDLNILDVTANIGDAVVAFRDWVDEHNVLAQGIKKALPALRSLCKGIGDAIHEFSQLPAVQRTLSNFGDAFRAAFQHIQDHIDGCVKRFREFVERVKSLDSISLSNLGSILADFGKNVLGYALDFGGIFDELRQAVRDFGDNVRAAFNDVGSSLEGAKTKAGGVLQKVVGFLLDAKDRIFDVAFEIRSKLADKLSFSDIFAIGLGAAMVAFTKKIADAMGVIASGFQNVDKLIESAKKVLDGVTDVLGSASQALKGFGAELKSKALLNAAQAILILVGALAVLTMLDQEKLKSSVIILGGLAAGLVAISFAMSKMGDPKDLTKLSLSVVSVGASMLLLAKALKTLEELDREKLLGSLAVLGGLALGMVAVTKAMGSSGTSSTRGVMSMVALALSLKMFVGTIKDIDAMHINNLGTTVAVLTGAVLGIALLATACRSIRAGSAVSILALAVSMKVMVGCFQDIAKLDPHAAQKSLGTFVTIFGMFAALIAASHLAGEHAAKAGASVMMMSAALILIVSAIKMMAELDQGDLDRGTAVIAKLLLVFAAVTMASNFAGKYAAKAGAMLLMMSGAILILSGIMVVLSHMDPSGLDRALAAVTQLLVVFGALVGVTAFAKDASQIKATLITLTVAVATLTAAVAGLSLLDPERLRGATVALSLLMTAFSLVIASTHLAKKATGTLIIMAVVVANLAGILTAMSILQVDSSLENAAALSLLLTAFSASLVLLSKAGRVAPSALISVGVLTAVTAGLAAILGAMAALNVEPSIESAASLSILLLSMSGACLLLSKAGVTGPAAFVGIGALTTLIAGMGVIMAAICALTADNPTIEEDLDRAIMVLEKIGTGLGAAVGGFVGGAIGGLSSGLPIIGANLSAFMENAQPFFETVKGVDGDALAGVNSLAQALLALTGANVLESLTSWFTGGTSLAEFAEQLVPFGEAFSKYAASIDGITPETVTASSAAAKSLAEFANAIPNQGGVLAALTGDNTLGAFAEQLESFGESFAKYAVAIKDVKPETVTASAAAARSLAEFASTLPNHGGLIADLLGDNTLSAFAKELVPFGQKFAEYAVAIKDVKPETVANSAAAAKSLAEFASALPNSGGILADWIGDNTLAAFAKELEPFGESFAKYAVAIKDVKPETVTASAAAAKSLAEMSAALPNSGGIFAGWTGDNSLSAFAEQLEPFGQALATYSSAVGNVDVGKLTESTSAIEALVILAEDLNNGAKQLSADGLNNFSTFLTNLANTGINDFTNEFNNCDTQVEEAISHMVAAAVAAIGNQQSKFENVGQNVSKGFIKGIASKEQAAASAGRKLGLAALNAAKKALDSHSPSREFIHLGENVGEGLAIGVNNSIVPAANAASGMINEVLAVSRKGIDAFEAWVEEKKYYNELSLTDELAGWENLQKKYKAGSEERVKIDREVYRIQNELVASTYQASIDWIEEQKYYNKLSLDEELAAYERMQTRYLEGSEERKKIDREVFRLRNELVAASYQASIDWIEEEKYYNRLSLEEELAAYERIQARYAKGSDEYKKMDREIYRVRNEQVDQSYQFSMDWIEKEKYYNRLSLEEELAAYERVQARYAKGTEEYEKMAREIYRVRNEIADKSYQFSMDWIEEEKYYKRLSLEEELAAYERVQARYAKGSEEYKKMAREIYRVRNELVEKSYQFSMDWIEEEKYYNRMALADELAAYKRVQARYAKGTEERKKMDREVYRLEKEIYEAQQKYLSDVQSAQEDAAQKRLDLEQEYADKVAEINERLEQDIRSLNDEYENALKSRTDTLYKSYGLFDAITEKEEVSAETLMKNLQGQVMEFGQWQDILGQLSARGLDSELIAELQEMGPSAIAEIKALNSMSDSELEKYVSLWSIKHIQAREQSLSELEGLRVDTQNNIAQLRVEANQELIEYRDVWTQQMTQLNQDTEDKLAQLQNEFAEKVGTIKKDTESELKEMTETANKILVEAGWDVTGQKIVAGLTKGVNSQKPSFLTALKNVALAGVKAIKTMLGIHSPSKVFQQLGEYSGMGFVQGLGSYVEHSRDAADEMASSAVDGATTTISLISDLIKDGVEIEPTIRPVLDLSNVARGAGEINGLFDTPHTIGLAGQASASFGASYGHGSGTVSADNSSVVYAIRELRGDVSALSQQLQKMRIVLDTGALVGSLSGPMDAALGQRLIYQGRGI